MTGYFFGNRNGVGDGGVLEIAKPPRYYTEQIEKDPSW